MKLMTVMNDMYYSLIKQNGLFITQLTNKTFNQRAFLLKWQ